MNVIETFLAFHANAFYTIIHFISCNWCILLSVLCVCGITFMSLIETKQSIVKEEQAIL